MKRFCAVLLALCAVVSFTGGDLFAQSGAPQMSASASAREIEVGEPLTVQLTVTVESGSPAPSDPQLGLPDGLRAGPASVSTQTQISLVNGHLSRQSGITATWQVIATREGVFAVSSGIAWNGHRVQANTLRITVHAASGSGGRQRRAQPSQNPFDPFGMFPRLPGFMDAPDPEPQQEPPPDPELALDAPLDSKVFLRSVVDQKNPVVGEQVTLTVYLYRRGSLELTDVHEPTITDFFRRELMAPNTQPDARAIGINGVLWRVEPIFKVALFPLKSGELEIGAMQATILGGRGGGPPGMIRQSQAVKIHVSEPPARGRPVGYQVGDVGFYSLSATVEPRKAEVDGAVAVTVSLGGVGNVPNGVHIPASTSFEWLEPQTRENIEVENGKVRGSRTFSYIVRPKAAGTFDLGEITLPYWNPDRKLYDITRVALGKVQVEAAKTDAVAKDPALAPHDPWSALAKARTQLSDFPRAREPVTEKPFYWLGLFGAPFAVVVGSWGTRGVKRLRLRAAARRNSVERGMGEALAEARAAAKGGDRGKAAGAVDRVVHLAIERATGLKARALLTHEIKAALEQRKVPAELAAQASDLLATVETIRFALEGAPDLGGLVARATELAQKLGRLSPPDLRGSSR